MVRSMADEIHIQPGLITDHGWSFDVTFGGRHRTIRCSQSYWKKMTRGDISPMDLVRLGLQLAMERQVTDALPETFSLEELGDRIHDFVKHVRRKTQTEAANIND